ncbi:MAG: hypothetical protein IJZ82_09275 [Lachnospiraceae bacterium]|nr:hypothetical protein [Lachnospiraceae bacterium]
MIVMGVCVRQNITGKMAALFKPLLYPLFRCRSEVIYCILVGFLCGFPMGARVTAQMYTRGTLSKTESEYLLSFCNNIGPVYCLSFVAPLLGIRNIPVFLGIMYGVPLFYGLLLRYTIYRKEMNVELTIQHEVICKRESVLQSLNQSIQESIQGITILCGYMIFFNLLNLLPHTFCPDLQPFLAPILEITGGLGTLENEYIMLSLIALSFGGLSCLAQTYSSIAGSDLSFGNYVLHRVILTVLSIPCYFSFLPFLF